MSVWKKLKGRLERPTQGRHRPVSGRTEGAHEDVGANERNLKFKGRAGEGRFAWHKFGDYVPPIYSFLTGNEWEILEKWYEDTESRKLLGECNIPFISSVQGFIMGSVINNIVQLGHFAGYSTLLIGFMMRRMKMKNSFITIDIDPRGPFFLKPQDDNHRLIPSVQAHHR
ncbi:MAG: hypothetical protein HZB83_05005 [Deltaproteobacteria bacterium]|nr:hypothetical protein [Deltaproteobacteria bacterium]